MISTLLNSTYTLPPSHLYTIPHTPIYLKDTARQPLYVSMHVNTSTSPFHSHTLMEEVHKDIAGESKKVIADIADPLRLLTDFRIQGPPFKGIPVITDVFDEHGTINLKFRWMPATEVDNYNPADGGNFHFNTPTVKRQISYAARDLTFDLQSLKELFFSLKAETPHQFTKDGCNPRCLWVSSLLQEVFHLDAYKIKIWSKDGTSLLGTKPPFPKDTRWNMHTAAVVRLSEEEDYVFDLSLDELTPLATWKNHLYSHEDDVVISTQRHWSLPCETSYSTRKGILDTFQEVIRSLRALYLFEVVDGNDDEKSSLSNWDIPIGALTHIETPLRKTDSNFDVVLSITQTEDQTFSIRKKTLAFCKGLFDSFIFYHDTYFSKRAFSQYRELKDQAKMREILLRES